jgi:pyridoxal phosphate enzyme (YggS family)
MSFITNFDKINSTIPKHVKLVAVSKTKPNEAILELYAHGVRIFGENKVQELANKFEELPKDIEWHYIGHLQTNKVKYIAPFVSLIHAVDSFKLLETINKEAAKNKRIIPVLLQLYIAKEETKFGFDIEELKIVLASSEFETLENIQVAGLMGMATNTENEEQISREFRFLKTCFDEIKAMFFLQNLVFNELSMGMSGDYQLAIEQGSTIVRVGSSIFGERNYQV